MQAIRIHRVGISILAAMLSGAIVALASGATADVEWVRRAVEGPPARNYHAMAYDEARGVAVVFGGSSEANQDLGDTWLWDGAVWTQSMAPGPSPRQAPGMAYDAARERVVLFGGAANRYGSPLGDTWEWDGATWTLRATGGPAPRWNGFLSYDSARGVVVMFGGYSHGGGYFGDTWEWNGTTWTLRATGGPSPRDSNGMAYDAARGVTVVTAGYAFRCLGDTWEWNGSTWTQRSVTQPGPRNFHATAYDAARGVTVHFGGQTNCVYGTQTDETLEWDGTSWTTRAFAVRPPQRWGAAMAYDSRRQVTVLFGGNDTTGGGGPLGLFYGDTWELGGSNQPSDLLCEVEMSKSSYAIGDPVVIKSLRFTNLLPTPVTTRLRLQLKLPPSILYLVNGLDIGADGSFAVPGNFDNQLGPVTMFTLTPTTPPLRGHFEWRCAFEDPTTGEVISEDRAGFDLP